MEERCLAAGDPSKGLERPVASYSQLFFGGLNVISKRVRRCLGSSELLFCRFLNNSNPACIVIFISFSLQLLSSIFLTSLRHIFLATHQSKKKALRNLFARFQKHQIQQVVQYTFSLFVLAMFQSSLPSSRSTDRKSPFLRVQ